MPPKAVDEAANINQKSLKNNLLAVSYFRIFCSLFIGAACGILRIQGLHGFAVYFLQHLVLTLPLVIKAGFRTKKFFPSGTVDLLTGQILASETFMTFLLLWTVLFNVGHIF